MRSGNIHLYTTVCVYIYIYICVWEVIHNLYIYICSIYIYIYVCVCMCVCVCVFIHQFIYTQLSQDLVKPCCFLFQELFKLFKADESIFGTDQSPAKKIVMDDRNNCRFYCNLWCFSINSLPFEPKAKLLHELFNCLPFRKDNWKRAIRGQNGGKLFERDLAIAIDVKDMEYMR